MQATCGAKFVVLLFRPPRCPPDPGEAHGGKGVLGIHAKPERYAAQHHVQLCPVYQA